LKYRPPLVGVSGAVRPVVAVRTPPPLPAVARRNAAATWALMDLIPSSFGRIVFRDIIAA